MSTLDTVHMYIHVVAVGLPLCYVVIVWLWGGIFMWCFMLCLCLCNFPVFN